MMPLDRLLHRIRWDSEFGRADFALGYEDRVLGRDAIVPFSSVTFESERPDTFTFVDDHGIARHVPMHRVRTVYRDGAIIWSRSRRYPDSGSSA